MEGKVQVEEIEKQQVEDTGGGETTRGGNGGRETAGGENGEEIRDGGESRKYTEWKTGSRRRRGKTEKKRKLKIERELQGRIPRRQEGVKRELEVKKKKKKVGG